MDHYGNGMCCLSNKIYCFFFQDGFRFINPTAQIRLAGGRALMADNGKKAFFCGANASITGNMLTTSGSTIKSDLEMLKGMKLKV